jgi:hypothetical protein
MKSYFYSSAIFLLLIVSCSPKVSTLTSELWKKNNWSEKDLAFLQFFLNNDLTLKREMKDGFRHISGRIATIEGKKYEFLEINKNQPGRIVKHLSDNKIGVSFEINNETRYLIFTSLGTQNGQYKLLVQENQTDFSGVKFMVSGELQNTYLLYK